MLICKFCSKECKNENSLRNHERLCKENPNHQKNNFYDYNKSVKNKEREVSNGYIKARNEGRVYTLSEAGREKLSIKAKIRDKQWHINNGKKVSVTINKKVAEGTWHTSVAKNMIYEYNGIKFHGTWELKYVKYLDSKGIKWERCSDRFDYVFESVLRKYTPDIYLTESDSYVEIKGYKTDKDEAKWNQFPKDKKLIVLRRSDLKALGIDIK